MKKIIGLDLGPTSIGWAFVNEAQNDGERSSIIDAGSRIVSLTSDEQSCFEKGKSITTNADRCMKHAARLNLYRYKMRRKALIALLKENSIIDDNPILYEKGSFSTFETLRLRALAATDKIDLDQFARVLLMINKKRGYKSSRKSDADEKNGVSIDSMDIALELYEKDITPGQYVYDLLKKQKKHIPDFYRSDLQNEFNRIYRVQREFYPNLDENVLSQLIGKNEKVTWAIIARVLDLKGLKRSTKGFDQKVEDYSWRVKGLQNRLDPESLAIVLSNINKQISASSGYLGAISDRSKNLLITKQTIGQYLWCELERDPHFSTKNKTFYRQDYLDEFERIWDTQSRYYPQLTPELKIAVRDIVIFYQRRLKSQKNNISYCEFERAEIEIDDNGIKRITNIGRKVVSKSSPLFQEFKIWQKINDLRVTLINEKEEKLKDEHRFRLFEELNYRERMSQNEILKFLFKHTKGITLNFKEIEGNKTNAVLLKKYLEIIDASGHDAAAISKLPSKEKIDTIAKVFETLGINPMILRFDSCAEDPSFTDQPSYRLWHLLYSYEGDNSRFGNDALKERLHETFGFSPDYSSIISTVAFPSERGSLSSKAIRRIMPYLKQGLGYSDACLKAGYKHSARSLTREERDGKQYVSHLDTIKVGSLRNPVVEKVLNQMINVLNQIVLKYGRPDEIRVELARDLKRTASEREEMSQAINKMRKENDDIRELLKKEFGIVHPSRNDIIRYRLYLELADNGFKTLYSSTYIPRDQIFDKRFNIEHIIPQSRLFDDSFSNKTLEATDINIEKGNDTALDYVARKYGQSGVEDYRNRIENLLRNGKISKTKRSHLLMEAKDIPDDFINRDLNDTRYISRKACEILETMVPIVITTNGSITARLREDWQLVNVMKELNWDKYSRLGQTETCIDKEGHMVRRIKDWTKRNDHRHHALDAITIAFTRSEFIQYLNNLNARSDKSGSIYGIERKYLYRDSHNVLRFKPPMPLDEMRRNVKEGLQSIIVSHKAKNKVVTQNTNIIRRGNLYYSKVQLTPRGKLHNETVHGVIERYRTHCEKVNASFTVEKIQTVASKRHRDALLERLAQYGGDPKKAFTGKNNLNKNPLYLNDDHTVKVPEKVKLVEMETIYTVRKPVDENLVIDKVVDERIKRILKNRLALYDNNPKKAFASLDENPIFLDEAKTIRIKRVKVSGISSVEALHFKRDISGEFVYDKDGMRIATDFVSPSNNHHVAVYRDETGNLQVVVVSFITAVARATAGLSIIDKDYRKHDGWTFLFTMKKNEFFVFPRYDTYIDAEGNEREIKVFDPLEIDLTDKRNAAVISPNLFRVQKIASNNYIFRHHVDTMSEFDSSLRDITWKGIHSSSALNGIVKVRVDHLGQIVSVGEY